MPEIGAMIKEIKARTEAGDLKWRRDPSGARLWSASMPGCRFSLDAKNPAMPRLKTQLIKNGKSYDELFWGDEVLPLVECLTRNAEAPPSEREKHVLGIISALGSPQSGPAPVPFSKDSLPEGLRTVANGGGNRPTVPTVPRAILFVLLFVLACGAGTPPPSVPQVTAESVAQEFAFNRDKADEEYRGNWYVVETSSVLRIKNGHRAYMVLKGVRLELDFADKAEASRIGKGDSFKALCKGEGWKKYGQKVNFTSCTLVGEPSLPGGY